MGLGEQMHFTFLGRVWTALCLFQWLSFLRGFKLTHLQVQNHHDYTRVAKDSSGDLEDDHQVQFHHDCIMTVMVNVLVLGPGRSIHIPPSEASLWGTSQIILF